CNNFARERHRGTQSQLGAVALHVRRAAIEHDTRTNLIATQRAAAQQSRGVGERADEWATAQRRARCLVAAHLLIDALALVGTREMGEHAAHSRLAARLEPCLRRRELARHEAEPVHAGVELEPYLERSLQPLGRIAL